MSRSTLLVLTTTATLLLPGAASAQAKHYPLEAVEGLRFHNVTAEPAMLQGKKGLKATISEEAPRRIKRTQQYVQGLVWIEDLDLSNGGMQLRVAEENTQPTLRLSCQVIQPRIAPSRS
jgi:hypothetical protein